MILFILSIQKNELGAADGHKRADFGATAYLATKTNVASCQEGFGAHLRSIVGG